MVLGTFPASGQARAFTFPPDPVPTGWVVRGAYRCVVEFIDDAGVGLLPPGIIPQHISESMGRSGLSRANIVTF